MVAIVAWCSSLGGDEQEREVGFAEDGMGEVDAAVSSRKSFKEGEKLCTIMEVVMRMSGDAVGGEDRPLLQQEVEGIVRLPVGRPEVWFCRGSSFSVSSSSLAL